MDFRRHLRLEHPLRPVEHDVDLMAPLHQATRQRQRHLLHAAAIQVGKQQGNPARPGHGRSDAGADRRDDDVDPALGACPGGHVQARSRCRGFLPDRGRWCQCDHLLSPPARSGSYRSYELCARSTASARPTYPRRSGIPLHRGRCARPGSRAGSRTRPASGWHRSKSPQRSRGEQFGHAGLFEAGQRGIAQPGRVQQSWRAASSRVARSASRNATA